MTAMNLWHAQVFHAVVDALGWTLVHFLWQGTLIAAVLSCVLALVAQRATQVRYATACGALVAMVIVFSLTFLRLLGERVEMPNGVALNAGSISVFADAGSSSSWVASLTTRLDAGMPWLILAWCGGLMVFAGRLMLGMRVVHLLKMRQATSVDDQLQRWFDELCARLQIRRGVALLYSARVHVPTVIGWLKPVVLLPATSLTGLSDLQIQALLAHELAHIRRNDYLVSLLQSVVEAVLFYHPGVWWISKQVRRERECCCDELAVRICGDRLAYARALSLLEERRWGVPDMALGANGGLLTMRIKRLLGYKDDIVSAGMAWVVVLAVVIAGSGSMIVRFAHAEAMPQAPVAEVVAQPVARQAADVEEALTADAEKSAENNSQFAGGQHNLAQSDRDPAGLSAAQQKQLEDAREHLQIDLKKLQSDEFKRQMDEVRRKINSAAFQEQIHKAVEAAKPNSVELQKQLEAARAQAEEARKQSSDNRALQEQIRATLNSQDFKKQIEQAKAEAARVNTPEFRKQMEQLRKEVQRFDEADFRKQMEKFNTPEFREKIRREQAQKFNTPEFREKVQREIEQAQRSSAAMHERANQLLAADGGAASGPQPQSSATPDPSQETQSSPTPRFDRPIRVSSGVMASQIVRQVAPVYPPDARSAKIQGTVTLHATIGKDGTVEKLDVVSGPPALTASAIEAVRQWQYKPYLLNGQPVEVEATINVNYTLEGTAPSTTPGPQANLAPGNSGSFPPEVISKVDPEYTAKAKQAKVSGAVVLSVLVNSQGRPENVRVVKGIEPSLDQNAVAAVEQYRFRPALENGHPVNRLVNLEVRYQIF